MVVGNVQMVKNYKNLEINFLIILRGRMMDLLKQEYVANAVTLFDLRLSEGEITVYLDCINFMLKNCSDEQINQ